MCVRPLLLHENQLEKKDKCLCGRLTSLLQKLSGTHGAGQNDVIDSCFSQNHVSVPYSIFPLSYSEDCRHYTILYCIFLLLPVLWLNNVNVILHSSIFCFTSICNSSIFFSLNSFIWTIYITEVLFYNVPTLHYISIK